MIRTEDHLDVVEEVDPAVGEIVLQRFLRPHQLHIFGTEGDDAALFGLKYMKIS